MLYPYVTETVRAGNTTGSRPLEHPDVGASVVRLNSSARNTPVPTKHGG